MAPRSRRLAVVVYDLVGLSIGWASPYEAAGGTEPNERKAGSFRSCPGPARLDAAVHHDLLSSLNSAASPRV